MSIGWSLQRKILAHVDLVGAIDPADATDFGGRKKDLGRL